MHRLASILIFALICSPLALPNSSAHSSEPVSSTQVHPLAPAIEQALQSLQTLRQNVDGYTASVVRRERVGGVLRPYEYFDAKVMRASDRGDKQPFSIYLRFNAPKTLAGREVLYVAGRNEGKMFVRKGGQRLGYLKTSLLPESRAAMHGNRYPVTEFGIENLLTRLLEIARADMAAGTSTAVRYFDNATVAERRCRGIEVRHANEEDCGRFHLARIFVDKEHDLPIHFESYGWPEDGGAPPLLELYSYTNLRLNPEFSASDFSVSNPDYRLSAAAR